MAEQKQLSASDLERAYEILQMLRLPDHTLLYVTTGFTPKGVLYHKGVVMKYLELPHGALERMVSLDLIECHEALSNLTPWSPRNHECNITQKGRLCLLDHELFDRLWSLADAYLKEQWQREHEFNQARSEALQAFRRAEQEAIDEAAKIHAYHKED